MKKILFLFCFLPLMSFGQKDTIFIDSVSLIQYSGGFQPQKTLNYTKSEPKQKFRLKFRKKEEVKHEEVELDSIQKLAQKYPNYDANRDMPLPINSVMILDKNGKFHPTAKWETYQSFPVDSAMHLLYILTCNIEPWTYHTEISVDKNGVADTTVVTRRRIKKPGGKCFYPGLGILVWSKGEIITFYSVCFSCSRVTEGSSEGYGYDYNDCIYIMALREEIERLAFSFQ